MDSILCKEKGKGDFESAHVLPPSGKFQRWLVVKERGSGLPRLLLQHDFTSSFHAAHS